MWALDNVWKYPVLADLSEEMIDGVKFLYLPGKFGIYKGLYLCFNENEAMYDLRRAGYAVGKIDTYDTAKIFLLESAKLIQTLCCR